MSRRTTAPESPSVEGLRVLLGWCTTGHHVGRDLPEGVTACPAVTPGGMVCTCQCHEAA